MKVHSLLKYGGGASLSPTCLCWHIPVSGKNTGKISQYERLFSGSFRDKSYPERLLSNSVECAPSEEQGINRELEPSTFLCKGPLTGIISSFGGDQDWN